MEAHSSKPGKKRRPMAEINVVPYIDVMLVLLVIFMITTPLLTEGVKVDLPQTTSNPLPNDDVEPLIITVTQNGTRYLNVGTNKEEPITENDLMARVAAVLRNRPETSVLVRGDREVNYGRIVEVMNQLQKSGAKQVGLITESPQAK